MSQQPQDHRIGFLVPDASPRCGSQQIIHGSAVKARRATTRKSHGKSDVRSPPLTAPSTRLKYSPLTKASTVNVKITTCVVDSVIRAAPSRIVARLWPPDETSHS